MPRPTHEQRRGRTTACTPSHAAAAMRALALLALSACGAEPPPPPGGYGGADPAPAAPDAHEQLSAAFTRIDSAAAAIDSIFHPLPLLRPAQEQALRSSSNTRQLERARALGVDRGPSDQQAAALVRSGRLVDLDDGDYWVVDDLEHSRPLVVPATRALLIEIGRRFQARLAELGAPAFRMEISSVLRTSDDQAALRRVNPNAATGESAHEYGTTVDVLYSAFAAPEAPIAAGELRGDAADLARRYARVAAERVAARRALELKAVLATVLLELQREGRVMVTLERLQPVFHMTVARAPNR